MRCHVQSDEHFTLLELWLCFKHFAKRPQPRKPHIKKAGERLGCKSDLGEDIRTARMAGVVSTRSQHQEVQDVREGDHARHLQEVSWSGRQRPGGKNVKRSGTEARRQGGQGQVSQNVARKRSGCRIKVTIGQQAIRVSF